MKSISLIMQLLISFIMPCAAQNNGITAVFNSKRNTVSIKSQHVTDNITAYVLQRSDNNVHWSDLYKVQASSFELNSIAKFTDQKPDIGKNYYRLKKIDQRNFSSFSPSIMVIIGKPGNNWIMYPVPVTNTLNLQYNGSDLIEGVISVTIRTMRGQEVVKLRLASTSRFISIPVGNLAKAPYDVQIRIKDEVVWNQRFIK